MGIILFKNVTLSVDSHNDEDLTVEGSTITQLSDTEYHCKQEGVNMLQETVQVILNRESKEQLKKSRQLVERQMKAIFIYPVAYVLIWIAPLIAHGIYCKHGFIKPPIVWLNVVGAFLGSSNCIIDATIFLWREKPWNITIRNIDTSSTEIYIYLK